MIPDILIRLENLQKPTFQVYLPQEMFKTKSTDRQLQLQVQVVWQPLTQNAIWVLLNKLDWKFSTKNPGEILGFFLSNRFRKL